MKHVVLLTSNHKEPWQTIYGPFDTFTEADNFIEALAKDKEFAENNSAQVMLLHPNYLTKDYHSKSTE